MPHSLQFVEQFDRLVRLCARRAEEPAGAGDRLPAEEVDVLLRAAAASTGGGEVTVLAGPTWPSCNGAPLDGPACGSGGLVARLRGKGLERLFVARDAEPSELLVLARALAEPAATPLDGAALTLRTVRVAPPADVNDEALRSTPAAAWAVPPQPGRDPFEPSLREPTPARGVAAVVQEQVVGGASDCTSDSAAQAWRRLTPMVNTPVLLRTIVEQDRQRQPLDALFASLAALGEVDDFRRVPELGPLLEELGRRAERALREGDTVAVRDIMLAVFRAADGERHDEARLLFQMTRRRLLAAPYLLAVARLLPRLPEERDDVLYLLARAGEEGAEAVIEHLTEAGSSSDRRAYFSALVRLQAGVASLMHMLDDRRWYVVRNAADLLGQMQVVDAEDRLLGVLDHGDGRVRRLVLTALGQLGTTRALHAVQESLNASEAGLRAHAAAVLAGTSWPYTVAAIRRRLREETDGGVELALVTALGRIASDEAIALLAELAAPPRLPFLGGRRAQLRTAAAEALAVARRGEREGAPPR